MTYRQLWILLWSVIVLVILLACSCAYPHDIHHPELDTWFSQLHSGKGPCCDGTDALRIDDADWESVDGHYRVKIQGEWVTVPDDAVVEGPNRSGPTMVWPFFKDGHPVVRCFLPGSMT